MFDTNLNQYTCRICDFKCTKKTKFDQHILTKKHNLRLEQHYRLLQDYQEGETVKFVCECGKEYKHKQSLYNHKRKCNNNQKNDVIQDLIDQNKDLMNQNKELINQNKEIVETIKNQEKTIDQLSPTITNITNNTNIIVMLNDKFKDAINLDDFLKTLTISLEDLNLIKDKGVVNGITNTVLTNLEKIDKDKRPVYCISDKKDSFYFKDKELWEKDKNNEKIKETINKVAFEQRKSLDKWKDANPDFLDNENKQEEYLKLINITTQDIENTENEHKIMRKIYKGIQNI